MRCPEQDDGRLVPSAPFSGVRGPYIINAATELKATGHDNAVTANSDTYQWGRDLVVDEDGTRAGHPAVYRWSGGRQGGKCAEASFPFREA